MLMKVISLLIAFTVPLISVFALENNLTVNSPITITILPKQSTADTTHDYQVKIIELALKKNKIDNVTINFAETFASQGRAMRLLNPPAMLDLVAAGPTKDRDSLYHAIKIPLYMGLLGYRVLVIRKDRYQEFINIKHPNELKALIACQAYHWPDSDILEANGYKVLRVLKLESMFTLVRNGRCDYFPRSITEGYTEIKGYAKISHTDVLAVFDDIILKYKFPYYLFTGIDNKKLAAQLEFGLEQAIADDSLINLMKIHPATRHIFPISQWKDKRFFHLFNPLLPESTPIEKKYLWLNIDTKKH